MEKNVSIGLLILRLKLGGLMLLHGLAKFTGLAMIQGMLEDKGLPSFLAFGVYLTEIVAPLLMMIGFRTRIAAVVYASGALVAMLLAHSADIFSLSPYGGWAVELLGLYLFGAVALFFTGAGKYAVSSNNKWD